jgi:hypothetical protein
MPSVDSDLPVPDSPPVRSRTSAKARLAGADRSGMPRAMKIAILSRNARL